MLSEVVLDRSGKRRVQTLDPQPLQVRGVAVDEQIIVNRRECHFPAEPLQNLHGAERHDRPGVLVGFRRAEVEHEHSTGHAPLHRAAHLVTRVLVRTQAFLPALVELA